MVKNVLVNRIRLLVPFLKQYELKGERISDFEKELGASSIADLNPSDVLPSSTINSIVNTISDKINDPYIGYTVGKQLIQDNHNPLTKIFTLNDSLLEALSQFIVDFDTESVITEYNLLLNKDFVVIYGDRDKLPDNSTWHADACFCSFIAAAICKHIGNNALASKIIVKIPFPEAIPSSAPFIVTQASIKRVAIQFPTAWLSKLKNDQTLVENKIEIDFISRMTEYIENNISNINMDDAAKFCGVSKLELRSQLHKQKAEFSTLVVDKRMAIAKQFLCTDILSIDEIAKKAGYANTPNFIRSFKKYEGVTPLKFRKSHSAY